MPFGKRLLIPASDGQPLAVWDSGGTGSPVVFAHGFPQSHYCWNQLWDCLGNKLDHYRFITYDFRGFGESSKHGEASWQRFLQDHLDIVKSLGLGKYHMVGHDWGGATALHVARFFPEQLKSAVVMNTNYWKTDIKGMWHLIFFNLPLVAPMTFKMVPDRIFEVFLSSYRQSDRLEPKARERYQAMVHDRDTYRFWIRLYRNMAKSLVKQALPNAVKSLIQTTQVDIPRSSKQAFHLPITLIWGANDTYNPLWVANDMETRLRKYGCDVKLRCVDDAGHFVAEEQPQMVAELLIAHLRENS